MAASGQVLLLAMGRTSDPLLEEIIAGEGYVVRAVPSLDRAISECDPRECAAVVVLSGEQGNAHLESLVRETFERFPESRMIVVAPDGALRPRGAGMDTLSQERFLWLQGEVGISENLNQIRGFLRGEGYLWASDLQANDGADTPLPDVTGGSESHQPEKVRSVLRYASDLARFTELDPMLHEALHRAMDILQCEAGSLYLWDDPSQTLILQVAFGPEEDQRVGLRQRLGEGLAGWVAEVGEPILVTDSRKVQRLKGRVSRRYANYSCLAVPITHGGQMFGVLCLTMPRDEAPFEPADLRLARALSARLAAAMRPLTVLSELRRFSERLIGAFRTTSDMAIEKDEQVETLRVLSSNILENIPIAVISYDHELRVRSSNHVARTDFAATIPNGPGPVEAPLEAGLDLDRQMWRARLLSVVESGRQFRLQRVGYNADARKLMLEIHCSPLRDSAGAVVGGILTAQNVTEDAELEMKLHSAERLAIIGKVAAKVAHELNNPLDGILRFLNLAMRQLDHPDQARGYLEECRSGLLRMSTILTELLAFSRSHRQPHAPMSISQAIRQAMAQYEHRARESSIRVRMDVPADLPPCPSNEVWEVFGNVIKNALDAMKDNGTLTVRAHLEPPNAIVTVSDTGPGVSEEVREKIFEPFFTTKNDGHGTGLGLALCRDALRRIGGEIRLVPSDAGATFRIEMPVKSHTE